MNPSAKGPDEGREVEPRVGAVSRFWGSRLLLIGLVCGVLGFGLVLFAGFELWRVVTRGGLGADVVPLVVSGALALSLLSIGSSARRTGLRYLRGERSVSTDVTRFVARRVTRRRRGRGG